MTRRIMIIALVGVVLGIGGAFAEDDPIATALEACEPELTTFCSQVTPGDGRLLACFFAHEDKVSSQCNWAIYQASVALEEFFAAIANVTLSCEDDLLEHCGDVEIGEGRVGVCLVEHEDQVSATCRQAMKDAELEVVE